MRICVFLSKQNEWFLSVKMTSLDICNHPPIDSVAISLSGNDVLDNQMKIVNTLYDVNVPPSKIAQILGNLKEDDCGTFLPKIIFYFNEKSRILLDFANRILPNCLDAEKTIKKLDL
jgi:hypothetical protein